MRVSPAKNGFSHRSSATPTRRPGTSSPGGRDLPSDGRNRPASPARPPQNPDVTFDIDRWKQSWFSHWLRLQKNKGGVNCGRWKFVERWQKRSKSRSLWDCFSPRQCHGRVLLWSLLHDSSKSKSRDDCSKVTVESRCWLVRVDECTKVFPFLFFVLWLWGW